MPAMSTPEEYGGRVAIRLRYRDMDTLGHLNQAVYHELLEEGRGAVMSDGTGKWIGAFVLARVELDYRREVRLADVEVVVEAALERIGRSSITILQRIVKRDGTVAAEGRTVMVAWDMVERRSREITDAEREQLSRLPAVAAPDPAG
ncbi:putative thioesterase [Patulibacter medicamentivorans]|uniref:Putative thioesterase n=2 Tax=Patulibacter medicamentivorans TaxID=1097667 RepID=H0E1G0_9ACTN|nr:putative thioesterase [Patulibacter medicamentivorans]